MSISNPAQVEDLIRAERLPEHFGSTVLEVYLPIAEVLRGRYQRPEDSAPALIGLNGCPGSGKSTLARFLERLLVTHRIAVLSLDDFYLTAAARDELAHEIHPLLRNRGMPGTHDTELLADTISSLRDAHNSSRTRIPVFDKSKDDRLSDSKWTVFSGRPDIILLEGWCIGVGAQSNDELRQAASGWESSNDPDGIWRHFVNRQLSDFYSTIFAELDMLILLLAPSVETIFEWRRQQEEKLRARANAMDDGQLRDFTMQFLRLTRHMYATLPSCADIVVEFEKDRSLRQLRCR